MKINELAAGLLIGLLSTSGALAQSATCNASVSKRTITQSETRESTWNIIFDVAAPGCDNSRGQFDYFVEVSGSGRNERAKETADFNTSNGQRTAVMVSHQAKPGQEVKDVSGIFVKSCTCVKAN